MDRDRKRCIVRNMSLDSPVSRRLLSDEVFDRLRDSIVRGELVPGEKVKDGELAERLGLSRTPVREALARLADIGLVEAKPGVYTRITTLNRRDVGRPSPSCAPSTNSP